MPINISPASATSRGRSSFPWRSLMDGSTILIFLFTALQRGESGRFFTFQNGFVNVVRDGRAGRAAISAAFDHDHDGVARIFIRRKRGKPGGAVNLLVPRVHYLCRAGLPANL